MENIKPEKCSILRSIGDFIVVVGRIVLAVILSFFRCLVPRSKKSLQNEIALITGSGRGLGRELALKFAQEGAVVVLWDINEKSILGVQSEIEAIGGTAHVYECDVSSEEKVRRVGKKVQDEVGDVTILVNNAGILQNLLFNDLDSEKIKKTLDINVLAHFWTIRYFLPRMLEKEKGHIVATASAAGLSGWIFMADYCASKFAVVGMMEVLEEEIRVMGKAEQIHFTTACPFTIDTGMNQNPTCRLPWLIPLLNAKDVAAEIITAVQREERLITIPRRMLYPCYFMRLLPRKVNQIVYDFLQYNLIPNNPHKKNTS